MSKLTKRTGIIIGISAAAVVIAGLVLFLVTRSGGCDADVIADVLPEDVMVLVWASDLGETLELADEAGIRSDALAGFGEMKGVLGFDPLSVEDLVDVGLDPSGTHGFALAPGRASEGLGIVYVATTNEKRGTAILRSLWERVEAREETSLILENGSVGDHDVMFVRLDPEQLSPWARRQLVDDFANAPLAGAAVDVAEGTFVVFPVDFDYGEAAQIEEELRSFVSSLLDMRVARLSSVEGYAQAVSGSKGALGGVYFNAMAGQSYLSQYRELAWFSGAISDVLGASALVVEEDNRLALKVRTVMKPDSPVLGQKRDDDVVDDIPIEAFVGVHLDVDSQVWVKQMERVFAAHEDAWEEYAEMKAEFLEATTLSPGTQLSDLWNGEVGFFWGALSKDPTVMVRSMVGFVGLNDQEKVKRALDSQIPSLRKFLGLTSTKVGDSEAYRCNIEGVDVGVMLYDRRLWVVGDFSLLERIQDGDGQLDGSKRGKQLTEVMSETSTLSSFADLSQLIGALPMLLSRHEKEEFEFIWPLLSKLDYVTLKVEQDDNETTGTFELHLEEGSSARKAVLETVSSLVVKSTGWRGTGWGGKKAGKKEERKKTWGEKKVEKKVWREKKKVEKKVWREKKVEKK